MRGMNVISAINVSRGIGCGCMIAASEMCLHLIRVHILYRNCSLPRVKDVLTLNFSYLAANTNILYVRLG